MTKTKVFISYSHDSDQHRDFVRGLSDRLCREGLDCMIDQYINGSPPEGWQRWMEDQIEIADFVLLICTETYLWRYRGHATNGGKGVNFEGVVISQSLYDAYYQNAKFIPVIPALGSYDHVPLPLKSYSSYRLPGQYDEVYRVLTDQAEYIRPKVGTICIMPPAKASSASHSQTVHIHSDRLPTVKGGFFGREAELQMLNDAWAGNNPHIIQFIAPGGTGKTKLLRNWLDHTPDIDALLAWSFYSQGSGEDKQISATPFFSHAFAKLGSIRTDFATEEDKGEHLAELLRDQRCVLVLDGLEPLQHSGRGMQGELKDRAIRQLLKSLAGQNNGLCIVTTRIAVHELCDRADVISHDLQNLGADDGVLLLQSLGVQGSAEELGKAVQEYGCHALALSLLGSAITTYLDGDISKRGTLETLLGEEGYSEVEKHVFKVMQAYQQWLQGTPELLLLYVLGLFGHPIEKNILFVLLEGENPQNMKVRWQKKLAYRTTGMSWLKKFITRFRFAYQVVTTNIEFNEFIAPINQLNRRQLQQVLSNLQEQHHLLSVHESYPDVLDCHPLVREYFSQQLRNTQPKFWQLAHEVLYEYYKALPEKKLPDTLEEMQPLFSAVTHGCAAGLYQQTHDEIFWLRIQRQNDFYLTTRLGAFSDDLAILAWFFTTRWSVPVKELTEHSQATVLNWTGFRLRALGQLCEALEPMQKGLEMSVKQKNWAAAAQDSDNISLLQLILGDIVQAKVSSQYSVDYAEQSGDVFMRKVTRATHAYVLFQSGELAAALAFFLEAEQIEQEIETEWTLLYADMGMNLCELLLEQGEIKKVIKRTEKTMQWMRESGWLLCIAQDELTLGRAYLQQEDYSQAIRWLNQAVAGLRSAGRQDHLPDGLFARANLHRQTQDFTHAHQDLQEVLDIAEPSRMRLHLTDYHLEMARLLLAEERGDINYHIQTAAHLIHETGYHRRDAELSELQQTYNVFRKSNV